MYNLDKEVTFRTSKDFNEVEKAIPTSDNVNNRSVNIILGQPLNIEVVSQYEAFKKNKCSFTTSKSK